MAATCHCDPRAPGILATVAEVDYLAAEMLCCPYAGQRLGVDGQQEGPVSEVGNQTKETWLDAVEFNLEWNEIAISRMAQLKHRFISDRRIRTKRRLFRRGGSSRDPSYPVNAAGRQKELRLRDSATLCKLSSS